MNSQAGKARGPAEDAEASRETPLPSGSGSPATAAPAHGSTCAPLHIEAPLGTRTVVVGSLLLGPAASRSSTASVRELLSLLDTWEGPGSLVLAGDFVDLISHPNVELEAPFRAHPELAAGLLAFASKPKHRLIWLPGLRDSRLRWDHAAVEDARRLTGAEFASSVELSVNTATGVKMVSIEPGHRFDSRAASSGNPDDTPLAHHLLAEVLPRVGHGRKGWLEGLDRVSNPSRVPSFVVSRLFYRRLVPYLWLILLPLVAMLALKLPLAVFIPVVGARARASVWPVRAAIASITTLADIALVLLGIALVSRKVWNATSGRPAAESDPAGHEVNAAARAEARRLVTSGAAGLVTAYSMAPELKAVGRGFYANAGALTEVVVQRKSLFGLPSPFIGERHAGWVEIEGGAELHVRLLYAVKDKGRATLLERTAAREAREPEGTTGIVASYPHGPWWPKHKAISLGERRARRISAAAIAFAGVADLLSALTPPPLRAHFEAFFDVMPFGLTQAAAVLVAMAGLALLALAGGVRRGQRQAWIIAIGLLAGTAVLQIIKRGDLLETTLALAVLFYLLRHQRSFRAAVDRRSVLRGALGLAAGAMAATVLGVLAVEVDVVLGRGSHQLLSLGVVLPAVIERLAGITAVPLPPRMNKLLTPTLTALGVALALWAFYLAFRPAVDRRSGAGGGRSRSRAREVVSHYGKGTLDYFALRDDKSYFFWASTVVAYALWGSVCLVSPDPVGPEAEREVAWAAFRRMADTQGWTVGVLGAGEEWLPVYRSSGMHDLYVGDEGVVQVQRFTLEGGKHKALRQAVNRIARNGYTLSFHTPPEMEPGLTNHLRSLMSHSRKGEVERGFSMTLGRAFDPADADLLVVVAHAPDNTPAAFCQFVPAPGLKGYSLDLMRRDDRDHPNGLMDFLIVGTIEHLRKTNGEGLGLNFATMRAVLAGEAGDSVGQRVERWLLKRMSESMQIESLWRFNAKYDPIWLPRYAVYDAAEHALAVAMAIARAESFWELPIIGRFLSTPTQGPGPSPAGKPNTTADDDGASNGKPLPHSLEAKEP